MRLLDARRLTGPNHLARTPLVIVELAFDEGDRVETVLRAYRAELGRMRIALGFPADVTMLTRPHRDGVVFGYEAPIDEMMAMAEMSEWAAESAALVLHGLPEAPLEPKRAEVEAILVRDRDARLVRLAHECAERGLPLLWDDADVSLGAGKRTLQFPRGRAPDPDSVDWSRIGGIPTVFVTGTNGKTTSSRLIGRIGSEAGLLVGTTSTGGVTVGSAVVEEGDWTGPAAARLVLRRPDVELAVLETARGGILRRGLALDTCDAALITNVSDDHLGPFGIDDVEAMTEVKGVVARAVRTGGVAVLNAADARLVALGKTLAAAVTLFGDLEGAREAVRGVCEASIAEHRAKGGRVVFTQAGTIVRAEGPHASSERPLMAVADIPITFGGAARYNVENVLGAVAIAEALGLAEAAIVRGLTRFVMEDNPGRGQVVVCGGVTVFLDFGHNPEGVRAGLELVAALRSKSGQRGGRFTVVSGSPGDRSDEEITAVAAIVAQARPDHVFVRELADYLRGRVLGEVPALFRRSLVASGLAPEAFALVGSEVEALERAFADARAGDFVALLVHIEHDGVQAFLAQRAHAKTPSPHPSDRGERHGQ